MNRRTVLGQLCLNVNDKDIVVNTSEHWSLNTKLHLQVDIVAGIVDRLFDVLFTIHI